ncbi:hypothetical protein [Pedobacter mendelii]|uniref:Uncharacterized protein n=1 Tax=Pedobacter mendelii TaxID=1908240 RepID=A0ABQ2BL62_9SPHI|nr:hypothetical protein [Pedobacter mendelii]GGI27267.1 hypothetical protein GCM10008119_26790 [Pedobacter mendelii]
MVNTYFANIELFSFGYLFSNIIILFSDDEIIKSIELEILGMIEEEIDRMS